MKSISQETRSETIFRHTQRMLHEQRTSMSVFAQRVVEHFHAHVAAEARCVEFKTEGDLFRVAATNAQKLHRYMEAEVNARLPSDLEESWVAGLTEPYFSDCRRELARRYGCLDVPLPDDVSGNDLEAVGRLTRDMGLVFNALAPVISDGQIDAKDVGFLPLAIAEVEKVLSAAKGLHARLVAALKKLG